MTVKKVTEKASRAVRAKAAAKAVSVPARHAKVNAKKAAAKAKPRAHAGESHAQAVKAEAWSKANVAKPAKARVLVVDDEDSILILARELLEGAGFSVATAAGGAECLDLLERGKPDLLILDVMMPGMTGLDVAEAVRLDPHIRDTKIIFLTVVKSMEIKPATLRKLSATDFIQKPFDNDDFLLRVQRAISGS